MCDFIKGKAVINACSMRAVQYWYSLCPYRYDYKYYWDIIAMFRNQIIEKKTLARRKPIVASVDYSTTTK